MFIYFAGHLGRMSSPRVVPSGLGTPGLLGGLCVRCGGVAVCREGRAAADRICSRTVASPGRVQDRSGPEEERQIKPELIYLENNLPDERKSRGGRYTGMMACVFIFSLEKAAKMCKWFGSYTN